MIVDIENFSHLDRCELLLVRVDPSALALTLRSCRLHSGGIGIPYHFSLDNGIELCIYPGKRENRGYVSDRRRGPKL